MAERVRAYVTHRTPSRLRIRVPARRRDAAWWQRVGAELRAAPGVSAVEVNPLTASILIHHDGSFEPARALAGHELLSLIEERRVASRSFLEQVRGRFAAIDGAISVASEGKVDLASLTLLGLSGLVVQQLLRGNVVQAPAVTLAWNVAELIRTRSKPHREDRI
jgi:hypothetical protein